MARKANIDRPKNLTIALPTTILDRLNAHLYSDIEARIPVGSHQAFFIERIREFFVWRREGLESFGFPAGYFIAGPKEMVDEVLKQLKGDTA